MSLHSGAHRKDSSTTLFFEVLGAENSQNDVVELWGGGGGHGGREVTGEEFNDTVFEVLGTENSKNDDVELWGGGGGHGGWEVIGDAGGVKTMSLNGGGEVTGEGGSPGTRGE